MASGGMISSILIHRMVYDYPRIVPLFVRGGLVTEEVEFNALQRFLEADRGEGVVDPVVLDQPLKSLFGASEWERVLSRQHPLRGRKLLMLTAAAFYCVEHRIDAVAFGLLRSDRSDESSPEVLKTLESCFRMSLGWPLQILTPYAGASDMQVMRRGRDLPLHHTFSCTVPVDGQHCGECENCLRRRRNFEKSGIEDRTIYGLTSID